MSILATDTIARIPRGDCSVCLKEYTEEQANNTTVCLKEYTEEQANNTTVVVELACKHIFHMKCITTWMKQCESPCCPECRYPFSQQTRSGQENPVPVLYMFHNKKFFNDIVDDFRKCYIDDPDAQKALSKVVELGDELFEMKKSLSSKEAGLGDKEKQALFLTKARELVRRHQEMSIQFKAEVEEAIKAITLNTGALRTLFREVKKWRGMPFEAFPEKMRTGPKEMRAKPKEEQTQEYGVRVQTEFGSMPLSGEQVYRCTHTSDLKDFVPEDMAFGKNNWSQYFGEVGEVPAFPEDISEILKAPCPFIRGKQVRDTHTLVLIPQTVDGRPFTLNLLEELIKKPREKTKSKFSYYDKYVEKELGEKKVEKSYWVLMTKDVIPESQFKTYKEQKQLVQEKGLGCYEIPSAIEVAASILMHFFQTDEVLYGSASLTYTRCQEKILNGKRTTAIGGFSREGLFVRSNLLVCFFDFFCHDGAAAVRKF